MNLEQLPAYEAARDVEEEQSGPAIISPVPLRPVRHGGVSPTSNMPPPPAIGLDELPPGYDEAQAQTVSPEALDERLRNQTHRQ